MDFILMISAPCYVQGFSLTVLYLRKSTASHDVCDLPNTLVPITSKSAAYCMNYSTQIQAYPQATVNDGLLITRSLFIYPATVYSVISNLLPSLAHSAYHHYQLNIHIPPRFQIAPSWLCPVKKARHHSTSSPCYHQS